MKKTILLITITLFGILNNSFSQISNTDTTKKFFIGSTLFMLGNLVQENKPEFVQLNLGYRISSKNTISLELKTWKYAWPLGIPYGDDFEAPENKYPGYIREYGFALVYQHYWWKGLYSSVHAMSAFQKYIDENGRKITNGFQLFMTYRLLGYHISLFKGKVFIEPSIAITHWPINTAVPESFELKERDWPNYFLFEPGMHFGINF